MAGSAVERLRHNEAITRAVSRGLEWLITHQQSDGTWEPTPIGLYYSAMWYSDSYYAVTLPMRALARVKARHERG